MLNPIKVAIIEDSAIHTECLKIELSSSSDFLITSINRYARSGIELIKKKHPNVVLLDFQLEDMTGLETAKRIKAYFSDVRIFMITAHTEITIIERILHDKHIDAFAIKGSQYFEHNLKFAVKNVALGGYYLEPILLSKLRSTNKIVGINDLTPREFEIFIQNGMGKSDEQIALDLCVEIAHVKNTKSKILKKIKKQDVCDLFNKLVNNLYN